MSTRRPGIRGGALRFGAAVSAPAAPPGLRRPPPASSRSSIDSSRRRSGAARSASPLRPPGSGTALPDRRPDLRRRSRSPLAPSTRPSIHPVSSSTAPCAPPRVSTVAWTVRSTASRRASGMSRDRAALSPRRQFPVLSSPRCRGATPVHSSRAGDRGRAGAAPRRSPSRAARRPAADRQPRMFNLPRGLWGYPGRRATASPFPSSRPAWAVPSAAIVVEELIALGARHPGPDRDLRGARPPPVPRFVGRREALPTTGRAAALRAPPGRVAADPAPGPLARRRRPEPTGRRPFLRPAPGFRTGSDRRATRSRWRRQPVAVSAERGARGLRHREDLLDGSDTAAQRTGIAEAASEAARACARAGGLGGAGLALARAAHRQPLLARGTGTRPGRRLAQRGQSRSDLLQASGLQLVGPALALRPGAGSPRPSRWASRRSSESSTPSSRWETERSRRVRRSMSAADGISALPSPPPGPDRLSRAAKAR